MHLVSHAFWPLVGSLVCLGSVVNAAGVVEIDVVFPRSNETYAPMDNFPIVFAVQNPQLAKHLDISVDLFLRNGSNFDNGLGHRGQQLTYANASTEPYFANSYHDIDTDGPYELFARLIWSSCDESGEQMAYRVESRNVGIPFTIKKGGQEADLVAATANDQTCSAKDGVAINVTDKFHEVPASNDQPAGTCAVLASGSPSPTANPCRVKIDTTVAASMSASLAAALCKGPRPPASCPKENAVQQLAVAGVASLAALSGAVGFLLA